MDTRNGHVKFLQVVGLCEDEYGLIEQGYFDQVASRICDLAPLSAYVCASHGEPAIGGERGSGHDCLPRPEKCHLMAVS